MVQQLRLHASTAGGMDSIPGMDSNPTCGADRKKKKPKHSKIQGII